VGGISAESIKSARLNSERDTANCLETRFE
jgi:hypothetical protein